MISLSSNSAAIVPEDLQTQSPVQCFYVNASADTVILSNGTDESVSCEALNRLQEVHSHLFELFSNNTVTRGTVYSVGRLINDHILITLRTLP